MSEKKSLLNQYHDLKKQAGDSLLFLRLGDFYELFYEDAKIASSKLGLMLTKRDCGGESVPMCGFPASSVDVYANKLVSLGHKVAICDQRQSNNQSALMDREIVRTATAGTITDETVLNGELNNYLLSLYSLDEGQIGAGWTDISTGEISYCLIDSIPKLNDFLFRLAPVEIICNSNMAIKSPLLSTVKSGTVCAFTLFNDDSYQYDKAFKKLSEKFGIQRVGDMVGRLITKRINPNRCVCALGALFDYIDSMRADNTQYLSSFEPLENSFMLIDVNACRSLELFSNITDNKKQGSLLSILDKTKTPMGARTLKKWLSRPLVNKAEICSRNSGVATLLNSPLDNISENLSTICDMERVSTKLLNKGLTPKECLKISQSLTGILNIKNHISQLNCTILQELNEKINSSAKLQNLIQSAIIDPESSINSKTNTNLEKNEYIEQLNFDNYNLIDQNLDISFEGNTIKSGINKLLDKKRAEKQNCEDHLNYLLNKEMEINNIKIKLERSKVNGYYFEVAKIFVKQIPYRFNRIQTLATCERFKTEALIETESQIIEIEGQILSLEYAIYNKLLEQISSFAESLLKTAKAIGELDCLVCFAQISQANNYTCPTITDTNTINIQDGRHPVVEKSNISIQSTLQISNEPNKTPVSQTFVPNHTLLDNDKNKIMLITGPNMSGKSVYMRQVALIVIMAHIGCFVPANSAQICIVDKIFTRIGSGDDVSRGRSTFMVEMSEIANILQTASPRSLLLIDEMGRGTSTYDGISLAWSVLETLSKDYNAKVLFSTHFHELTKLEGVLKGINNYKMSIKEEKKSITFLRKLTKGYADRSFGIEVASLAGISETITSRAREVMEKLEKRTIT